VEVLHVHLKDGPDVLLLPERAHPRGPSPPLSLPLPSLGPLQRHSLKLPLSLVCMHVYPCADRSFFEYGPACLSVSALHAAWSTSWRWTLSEESSSGHAVRLLLFWVLSECAVWEAGRQLQKAALML